MDVINRWQIFHRHLHQHYTIPRGHVVLLCSLYLKKCFNDFLTSCFIFTSLVLSKYCRGLPGSQNNQLCIPLKMHICAFVYLIGLTNVSSSPQSDSRGNLKRVCDAGRCRLQAARGSVTTPCVTVCQSFHRHSPVSSHLACRERFLWHLVIRLQWSLLSASQLNDDPVLHIEPTQRIGAWCKSSIEREREMGGESEMECKCWLGMAP